MTSVRDAAARAIAAYGHKLSKKMALYGEGMRHSNCGLCSYMEKPSSCRLVAGHIEADDLCRYFDEKVGEA